MAVAVAGCEPGPPTRPVGGTEETVFGPRFGGAQRPAQQVWALSRAGRPASWGQHQGGVFPGAAGETGRSFKGSKPPGGRSRASSPRTRCGLWVCFVWPTPVLL